MIRLYALITFALTLCLFSCGNEETSGISVDSQDERSRQKLVPDPGSAEDASPQKNLIKEFDRAEKFPVTRSIDFTKREVYDHLIYGWTKYVDSNGMWADGPESSLIFVWKANEGLMLNIKCRPFLPSEKKRQRISVFVNDQNVGSIELRDQWGRYQLEVAKDLMEHGINYLEFRYDYVEKVQKSTWRPDFERSVAFRAIDFQRLNRAPFRQNKLVFTKEKIKQPPDTYLCYYEYIPAECSLVFDVEFQQKTLFPCIKVKSDKIPSEVFEIRRETSKKIDLSKFADNFVEITLWAEYSSPDTNDAKQSTFIEWSDITLLSPGFKSRFREPDQLGEKTRHGLEKANVIYVVFDAFDAAHSSLYGYKRETTPFLERLAEEAVVFENMFANAPYTLASVGTLFTSRYSGTHGLVKKEDRLNRSLTNINRSLSKNNVETYLISDHPFFKKRWGLNEGFSTVYNQEEFSKEPDQVISALDKIDLKSGSKYIYIHLIPPHSPYDPPEIYRIFMDKFPGAVEATSQNLGKIKQREIELNDKKLEYIVSLYDANILYADSIAERIYSYLKQQEVLKKSILIFTSDHGEAFNQHGFITHGPMVYDEAIHIPFVVRFPEGRPATAKKVDTVTSLRNMACTLLDIFNIENEEKFHGVSLLSLISKEAHSDAYIYSESLEPEARCVRSDKFKYIHHPWNQMLLDIQNDPGEMDNIGKRFKVLLQYHFQFVKPHLALVREEGSEVDLKDEIDRETIEKLRGLGYVK